MVKVLVTYSTRSSHLRGDLVAGQPEKLAVNDFVVHLFVPVEVGPVNLLLIVADVARRHIELLAHVGAWIELRFSFSGLSIVCGHVRFPHWLAAFIKLLLLPLCSDC